MWRLIMINQARLAVLNGEKKYGAIGGSNVGI